jgi:hypothetical protein
MPDLRKRPPRVQPPDFSLVAKLCLLGEGERWSPSLDAASPPCFRNRAPQEGQILEHYVPRPLRRPYRDDLVTLPRRIFDSPTRPVIAEDWPHPPVEPVTVAARLERVSLLPAMPSACP